jgi:hypothetical protein
MPHLLIRQKTTDYAQWREAFDSMAEDRSAAGLRTVLASRNQADPDELVVLFEVTDPVALKEYLGGDGLKAAWERGRVIPETNQVTFLAER